VVDHRCVADVARQLEGAAELPLGELALASGRVDLAEDDPCTGLWAVGAALFGCLRHRRDLLEGRAGVPGGCAVERTADPGVVVDHRGRRGIGRALHVLEERPEVLGGVIMARSRCDLDGALGLDHRVGAAAGQEHRLRQHASSVGLERRVLCGSGSVGDRQEEVDRPLGVAGSERLYAMVQVRDDRAIHGTRGLRRDQALRREGRDVLGTHCAAQRVSGSARSLDSARGPRDRLQLREQEQHVARRCVHQAVGSLGDPHGALDERFALGRAAEPAQEGGELYEAYAHRRVIRAKTDLVTGESGSCPRLRRTRLEDSRHAMDR
jgi:hypothetical protein